MQSMANNGLLHQIFGSIAPQGLSTAGGWRTFTDLAPNFTSFGGKVFEQELTRAVIERFATACSKLKPEFRGNPSSQVKRFVESYPNPFMTWPQLLARTAAIYDSDGTAFIVPLLSADGERVTGIYPLKCEYAEVLEFKGEEWIRFTTLSGENPAIELRHVCILNKLQVESDIFGEPNCIDSTMQLIHAQEQAQASAIKNGARIRFIGSLNGMVREEDLKKKRDRFMEDNFGADNAGGLMLYDSTFADVKQVDPTSYTISEEEMQRIQGNVFNYFGISEDIVQNRYTEDTWGAWYEGKVEPFAVALGEGITRMCFSARERKNNLVTFSSNRLEYASNASKRNMVRDMLDRGVFSLNEAREVLQLPPIEGGDIRVIRGEYVNSDAVSAAVPVSDGKGGGSGQMPANVNEEDRDPGGDDDIYKDSDGYGKDDFEDD